MADATPIGTAIKKTNPISQILPQSADFNPALCANLEGKLIKKSRLKRLTPSKLTCSNKITRITSDIQVSDKHINLNRLSFFFLFSKLVVIIRISHDIYS